MRERRGRKTPREIREQRTMTRNTIPSYSMHGRRLALAAGAALVFAPLGAHAADAYKAPRTASGQPDIGGYWSNATLTPMVRDSKLGDRLAYTPAEPNGLAAVEAQQVAGVNGRAGPNAPVYAPTGLELKPSLLPPVGDF